MFQDGSNGTRHKHCIRRHQREKSAEKPAVPRPEACRERYINHGCPSRQITGEAEPRRTTRIIPQLQLPPGSQTETTTRCSGGRGESRFDHEDVYCGQCDHPERQHVIDHTNPTAMPRVPLNPRPLPFVYLRTISRTLELSLQSSFQLSLTVLVRYRSRRHI